LRTERGGKGEDAKRSQKMANFLHNLNLGEGLGFRKDIQKRIGQPRNLLLVGERMKRRFIALALEEKNSHKK